MTFPHPITRAGTVGLISIAAVLLYGAHYFEHRGESRQIKVQPSEGGAGVQKALSALDATGGEVVLAGGTYECDTPLIIRMNNVTLRGMGRATVLSLKPGANCPLMIIGDEAPSPRHEVRGVHVSDLSFHGNREDQDVECWDGSCDTGEKTVIRSCGVVVRRALDVTLERLYISRCRSAGLVTEKGCRRLTIRDLHASDNHFDGLACYETEDSLFEGLHLHRNVCAGISTDIKFNHNVFSNVILADNGKQGIFMRDSRHNILQGVLITGSGEQGVFLAQSDKDVNTGAVGNSFNAMTITGSKGPAVRCVSMMCPARATF